MGVEELTRILKRREDESGFTLLELLVAIVIISILAGIASQYYYHQRRKGWNAQAKAAVRNMAASQNSHVYTGGAVAYSEDLDDLWYEGFRYNTKNVIPHVAVADTQSFCVQVNSGRDPSIVWHFSSNVGYPEEGPATAQSCGDATGTGTYVTSGTGARDGVTSTGTQLASDDPGVPGVGVGRGGDGDGSVASNPGGSSSGGNSSGDGDDDGEDGGDGDPSTTGGSSSGGGGGPTDDDDDETTTVGTTPSIGNGGGSSTTTPTGNNGNGGGGNCPKSPDPDGGVADHSDCNAGSGNDTDGTDDNNGKGTPQSGGSGGSGKGGGKNK